MAKNNFSLNFDGFLDLANQIDQMGEGYLKKATDNALSKSKDYANNAIIEAMKNSPYAFEKGHKSSQSNKPSTGKALKSVEEVDKKPIEWEGTIAKAYIGANLKIAPEAIILAMGTPHIQADTNLRNALKVKGKYAKEVSKIQQEEFMKVMEEGQHD